ncbi:MAG TPA: hypothetical protein VI299_10045 [Polyangiales bacterium]
MKHAASLTRSLLLPLLAAGCYDIDDLAASNGLDSDAALDDGGLVSADAGWSAMPMRDAQIPGCVFLSDCDTPRVDAAQLPDAEIIATCASASDCAEGELCAPHGLCMARCEDSGACIVASTKREVTSLVASGSSAYVALAPTHDRFFNANPDAELRTIVGDAPWSLLSTRSTARLSNLELHGDHLYWQEDNRLFRMPHEGGSAVEPVHAELVGSSDFVLSDEKLAVRTNDGLFVANLDGSGTAAKVLAASDCPMESGSGSNCTPLALTTNAVFYRNEANDGAHLASIDLGTSERKEHGWAPGYTWFSEVVGQYFYGLAPSYNPRLYRRDLSEPNLDQTSDFWLYVETSNNFFVQAERPVQLHGDWLYVLATTPWGFSGGEDRKFVRVAATGPVDEQNLLPPNFAPRGRFQPVAYAVGDAHVFVAVSVFRPGLIDGSLIYRIPLPQNH